MKKKNIIIIGSIVAVVIVVVLLLLLINNGEKKTPPTLKEDPKELNTPLFELEEYKNVKLENIDYIEKIFFGEGGDQHEKITDKSEIEHLFNELKSIKLGEETDMACEDNTTIYVLYQKDGTKVSIEFECNWLVIGRKRYLIKAE